MSLERDLLEQEWNGVREVQPGYVLDTHIRWYGDEERVTIEQGEDEHTRTVFYGRLDDAQRWLDALDRDMADDAVTQAEVWEVNMRDGAQEVGRYTARGWGNTERGYVNTVARNMQGHAAERGEVPEEPEEPEVIHVKLTEERVRVVTIRLDELPGPLRRQLTDGIVSDMKMADQGALALIVGALGDRVLVPVTGERISRHVEQVFRP